ncbi:hypothetical protein ML462_13900 [Gramella lutea]|uniref:Uncharacterized protein n=1 Tax=Christiangramia lutea TaxID=1607951 RepID=A0A9X1V4T3_9FLAO|nr:hypothetical protein [Christiangramia lutea]MCH4824265.1 hypothetical protein [Christiangramia lutea]
MKANFNDLEKKVLKGQASKLADKHLCSQKYVKLIIDGKREVKSSLSKNILHDLLKLIEVLSPKPSKGKK